MENTIKNSVERFLSKYKQQEVTAALCGFKDYNEMVVNFWYDRYAGIAYVSMKFPVTTRFFLF